MRALVGVVLSLALASMLWAQDPGNGTGNENAEEKKDKPEAPQEAPKWTIPEREAKKLQKLLSDYVHPGRKTRGDILPKFQKFVDARVEGHSVLEDVDAWTRIATSLRAFDAKLGRKGKVSEVAFKSHGFPGIGTVAYHLYLPRNYDPRNRFHPVIFCLPDNKAWPDGTKYIEDVWVKRSEDIANDWIVVAPKPHTKGERWSTPNSRAKAMITLRHVLGTFEAKTRKKGGGPHSDPSQVFIDGEDLAGMVAARFSELFAGAILRNANGRDTGRINLKVGGLNGLPAYCICGGKNKKAQVKFAQKLKAANAMTEIVEDDKFLGAVEATVKWLSRIIDAKTGVRTLQPRKIEYMVHDASFQRHYWINILEYDASTRPAPMLLAEADRAKNEIRVDVTGISRLELFLNDAVADLNKPVKVIVIDDGKEMLFREGPVERNLGTLLAELVDSNQPWRIYAAKFVIDVGALRARVEKEEAAKRAKADAEAKEKEKGTSAGASVDKK